MSVYYAASQAEALLCRGDPVAIVGGGNSAGQAAVFLSRHAARVTLIVREHGSGRVHVPVPHRPGQPTRERAGPARHRGAGTARRPGAGSRRRRGQPDRRSGGPSRPGPCSSSSASHPIRAGSAAWSSSMMTASSGPGPTPPGRPTPSPELRPAGSARCSRPADPVSLLSAMSAAAQPNGSPRPWARARWRSGSPSKEHGLRSRRACAVRMT